MWWGEADTDVLSERSEVRTFLVRVLLPDPCLLPVSTLGRSFTTVSCLESRCLGVGRKSWSIASEVCGSS